MRDSLPVELSPFLRCVILLCERGGKISVTRNSALAGRRSGWKPASRVESELIRGEKIRRILDLLGMINMRIVTTIPQAQAQPNAKRRVLVPTMGALHKAHGEMVRVAR